VCNTIQPASVPACDTPSQVPICRTRDISSVNTILVFVLTSCRPQPNITNTKSCLVNVLHIQIYQISCIPQQKATLLSAVLFHRYTTKNITWCTQYIAKIKFVNIMIFRQQRFPATSYKDSLLQVTRMHYRTEIFPALTTVCSCSITDD